MKANRLQKKAVKSGEEKRRDTGDAKGKECKHARRHQSRAREAALCRGDESRLGQARLPFIWQCVDSMPSLVFLGILRLDKHLLAKLISKLSLG